MPRRLRNFGVAIGMIVFTGLGALPAQAQLRGDPVIEQIVVEGNNRIEEGTVRAYLTLQPADLYDPAEADQSLKALFGTGLFADVSLTYEAGRLIVRVVENPIINRIAFEGNQRVKDDVLDVEVQLRPRVVYTRSKVQSDVQRLLEIYRRNGRFAATVDPKVIRLPQNRVDLVFEINEGSDTGVRDITFVGNRFFDDGDLRDVINTRESAWWRILTTTDNYDPDRLTFDRELLRRYYLRNGFADFRVVSSIAELTPDRTDFFITFTVDEGTRYRIGEVDVLSRLKDVDGAALAATIAIKAGDWYDVDQVEEAVDMLTDAVGNLGYAFVDVRPRVRRDRENGIINVTFEIQEGPKVFVQRIDISGNIRTLDKVVRREFRLVEGDAFNAAKLRRSRQRIENLDFFDKVTIETVPGDAPDQSVIEVTVEEKSTGEFSVGAGFGTSQGLFSTLGIRERNLLGRGQDLKLSTSLGQTRQQIDLSFTEPYFLDRELRAGFDLFMTETDNQDRSSFDERRRGGELRLGFAYTENLTQNLRYELDNTRITDVDEDASRVVKEEEGTQTTSSIGQTLVYDVRDSRLQPTEGYFVRLSNDLAGFGGSERYLRSEIAGGMYWPLTNDWVLSVIGRGGAVIGLGRDVGISDRFFLGGNNLRGFEDGGAGPRDLETGDALGGNFTYGGSLQLDFPLGLPNEFGIRARVFADAGSLTEIDNASGADIADTGNLRFSAGFGLSWQSPFGPIGVDIASPLVKEDHDKDELIRVNFGTSF